MQDINVYQLVKFYAKKWFLILLITAIGVGAGYAYNEYIQTPLYKSSATLLLVSPAEKRTTQDVILINNYLQLFKSRRVLEPVIKEQNVNISYDTLAKSIEATNEKSTEVIKVAISTPNPDDSQKLVEGTIESFNNQAKEIYNLDNIKIVDEASRPDQPYNVSREFVLAGAGLGGFGAALLGLFFAYDYNRTRDPKTEEMKKKQAQASAIAAKPTKAKKTKKNKDRVSLVSRLVGVSHKPKKSKKSSKKTPKSN